MPEIQSSTTEEEAASEKTGGLDTSVNEGENPDAHRSQMKAYLTCVCPIS